MNVWLRFIVLFFFFVVETHGSTRSLTALQTTWGLPGHTSANDTVFGFLARLEERVTSPASNPLASFKGTILGRYDGDFADNALMPFSLFSECVEIGRFLRSSDVALSDETLEMLEGLIGTPNDVETTTLFGILKQLSERVDETYEVFAPLIGLDVENDASVFNVLHQIQTSLLPEVLGETRATLPFLTNTALQALHRSKLPGALVSVLRQDIKLRLTAPSEASLLEQLFAVRTDTAFLTPDAVFLIGQEGSMEAIDSDALTLISRVKRLGEDVDTASVEQIEALYPLFFYGINSFQTVINEVKNGCSSGLGIFFSRIGGPSRLDASLFGCLNQALIALELKQTLQILNGPSDPDTASALELLERVYEKPWQEAELERVILTLGRGVEPEGVMATTLLGAIPYLATVLKSLALFASHESIQRYRALISGNFLRFLQQISTSTKVDTLYVLCGGTTDTGTKTLWGIIRILLSDLTDILLKMLEDGVRENPILTAFFEEYSDTKANLEKLITHYHDNLFRLDVPSFLEGVWESAVPFFPERKTLDTAPYSGNDAQDYLPFCLRLQALSTSSVVDEAQLAALQRTLKKAIHDLMLGNAVKCLTENGPDKLETLSLTLSKLGAFEESLSYIGSRKDGSSTVSTVQGLCTNLAKLLEDPMFFWTQLQIHQAHYPTLTSFSLFSMFSLLGSPFDSPEQSLTERSFFAALNHLIVLSESAEPAAQRDNIAATIGVPSAKPKALYHSLFSLLNTILNNLFRDTAQFFLTPKVQASDISASIADELDDLLQEAAAKGYLSTPLVAPLKTLGTKETRTGIFGSLATQYENINKRDMDVGFMYNFLAKAIELSTLIKNFQKSFLPLDENNTEAFCAQVRKLVRQLEHTQTCEACQDLMNLLDRGGRQLAEWGRIPWTEKSAENVFSQATFIELSAAVQNLNVSFEEFEQALKRGSATTCVLKNCLQERLALTEAFKSVQDAVSELMVKGGFKGSSNSTSNATFLYLDDGCTYFPSVLKQFCEGLSLWSQSWALPAVEVYIYDSVQDEAWKTIVSSLRALLGCAERILLWVEEKQKTDGICSDCQQEGWEEAISATRSILPSFMTQVQEMADFLTVAPQQRLVTNWERIVVLLKKRRNLRASRSDLWTVINSSEGIEIWQALASEVDAVSEPLSQTLAATHKNNESQVEATFGALEMALSRVLKTWLQLHVAIEEAPCPVMATLFENSGGPADSLESLLGEIQDALSADEDLGNTLVSVVAHPEVELQTSAAVSPLERLGRAYGVLAEVVWQEANFSQETFPYSLYDAPTCQILRNHLTRLAARLSNIQQAFTQAAQELKALCPQKTLALLRMLTSEEKRLTAVLNAVPDRFWTDPTKVEPVITLWSQKMQIAAQIGKRMEQNGDFPQTDFCQHFILTASLERLNGLVQETVQVFLEKTGVLDPGPSTSSSSTAVQVLENFKSAFSGLTVQLGEVFARMPPLVYCTVPFSNALLLLRKSCEDFAKTLEVFANFPFCLTETSLIFPEANLLKDRAQVWEKANACLTRDLQCTAQNEAALRALVPMVRTIAQQICVALQTSHSPDVWIQQVSALEKLNQQTDRLITFFQNAEEAICLAQLSPFLKNIEEALALFQNASFSTLDFQATALLPQDTDLLGLVDALIQPFQELKHFTIVELASNSVPSPETEQAGFAYRKALQRTIDAVQTSAQNMVFLSAALVQFAPRIACSTVLQEVAARLNCLAGDECIIASALTTYALKVGDRIEPLTYERRDAAIVPAVSHDGLLPLAWLERVRARHQRIHSELQKLQKIIGLRQPTCTPKHSFPLDFVHFVDQWKI